MRERLMPRSRAFDMTLEIDATPEEVWRALTEAEELVRWFPLQARVTPGATGTMHWSWDGKWDWDCLIDRWEPMKRLRLVHATKTAVDAAGNPVLEARAGAVPASADSATAGAADAATAGAVAAGAGTTGAGTVGKSDAAGELDASAVALDFTIDTHDGRTRLRLVHSGFGFGGSWDEEFDSIKGGWQFELRGLRHYLERHRGRTRTFAWGIATTSLSPAAVWARLTAPDGLGLAVSETGSDSTYTLDAATGDRFSGPTYFHVAGSSFAGVVPDLRDGIVRAEVFREAGRTGTFVALASYAPEEAARVKAFGARAQALLDRLFPAAP